MKKLLVVFAVALASTAVAAETTVVTTNGSGPINGGKVTSDGRGDVVDKCGCSGK